MTTCPCCGYQDVATAKASKSKTLQRLALPELDALTRDGRRDYFKRTSPADDAYFFAASLDRQGYTDRAERVRAIGARYESGQQNRATTFAQLQIERFGWGRDRTDDPGYVAYAARARAARLERAS